MGSRRTTHDRILAEKNDEINLGSQEEQTLVSFLARTGTRVGEVLALQWEDIDFHGRFVEVCRTFSHHRISTPKSGKARRVDLSLQLIETLKGLLLERKKETLRKGWGEV